MSSKIENSIDLIDNIQDLKDEISSWEKDFKETKEVLAIINDKKNDLTFYHDLLISRVGFKFDISKISSMKVDLKLMLEESNTLQSMVEGWNSDDSCVAACSDPGLQYEQVEIIETMWSNLVLKYTQ